MRERAPGDDRDESFQIVLYSRLCVGANPALYTKSDLVTVSQAQQSQY